MPMRWSHPQPCNEEKHASKSPQVRRTIRHSLRDGYGLCGLSQVTGSFLPPSLRWSSPAKLDPSVGIRTTRLYRPRPALLVSQSNRVHRISRSTFMTTCTPLFMSSGRAKAITYFWKTKHDYFRERRACHDLRLNEIDLPGRAMLAVQAAQRCPSSIWRASAAMSDQRPKRCGHHDEWAFMERLTIQHRCLAGPIRRSK